MGGPLISFGMYDLPELRPATDALSAAVVSRLRAAEWLGRAIEPERILLPEAIWESPDLLLAQTCGYPLTHSLRGRVQLVATPRYRVPGCEGPYYRSVVVVRSDSSDPPRTPPRAPPAGTTPPVVPPALEGLRGSRCVINDWASHSGMNALRALIAPLAKDGRFFGEVTVSGSHAESLVQVAAGRADVAAIDCVTYALLADSRPSLVAATQVVAWTELAPALPFITRAAATPEEVDALGSALAAAIADEQLGWARDRLRLAGVERLPLDAYERIVALEDEAVRRGYPRLA